ncbi:hypothetical protein DUNSADRAFT_959 [Dunaliella salina]|uniref:Encoded protein n=1 Tax=Dunaliella salina TaxID=3046 RepID=A0ABQ7GXU6_DUNSA|nr:hypothetical protein DUNSADRAFT_959 [Dunaliella salina]|eukprot:KAF5839388.1 hypothetical protein DUNSADRAFT_959 [Dunaliella salina]
MEDMNPTECILTECNGAPHEMSRPLQWFSGWTLPIDQIGPSNLQQEPLPQGSTLDIMAEEYTSAGVDESALQPHEVDDDAEGDPPVKTAMACLQSVPFDQLSTAHLVVLSRLTKEKHEEDKNNLTAGQ